MVDKTKIRQLAKKYFGMKDHYIMINDQGLVSYEGDVFLKNRSLTNLPFQFEHIEGSFFCNHSGLSTLEGSPRTVSGEFMCTGSQHLTSLQGGPVHVGDGYYCTEIAFESMEGAPEHVGEFNITYTPVLPLLRLLTYENLWVQSAPAMVRNILNTYAGTTNPADVLKCASELNEHGFEGNAEW